MQRNSLIGIGALVVIIVLLLVWARGVSEPRENVAQVWRETNVLCLPFGHQNLVQHIHPHLTITVDGESEPIPANTGVNPTCMSELHTHDATGQLHIETTVPNKTFTILDYFAVRGESIEREGYNHQVFVNSMLIDPTSYTFEDLDRIEVRYTGG